MPIGLRGGWRQRLQQAAAGVGGPSKQGHLANRVLQMWSWGQISAPAVQFIMEGAVLDGCSEPSVIALSKVGCSGLWPQNVQRDISRQFFSDVKTPSTYCVDVLAKNNINPLDSISVAAHLLLPHQMFATLCDEYPKVLRTGFGSAPGGLREFWRAAIASEDPHLHGHPVLDLEEGWQDLAIPLTLYGDGARFARVDSLEIIAWSMLLSKECTWAKRFVSAAFVKSAEWGKETWKTIWEVLAWSFAAIFRGRHPELDHRGDPWHPDSYGSRHAGQPLSRAGYFGVVQRVCGDLDWYQKRLGMRVAPAGNLPCAWCDGGRPPAHPPFLHLQPSAAWIQTVHVPPAPAPSSHPIWTIPGVSKFTVALDLMHCLDLGVLSHFLGSSLHTLLYDNDMRGTLVEREAELWTRVRGCYAENAVPTRVSSLTRSRWCDADAPHTAPPVLKFKAAETRYLLLPVLDLCERYGRGTPRDDARLIAAEHMVRLLGAFNREGTFLSDASHRAVMEHMWGFFEAYHALNADAAGRDLKVWHLVNKFHMLVHLCYSSRFLNPVLLWTYGYEDLVGRMKRIAMASKSGLKTCMLSSSIFLKYRKVVDVALKKAESDL